MSIDWLNRLCKWRSILAGWQLGTRADTDPECQAVRDHREVTLLLRAEVNALTQLLVCGGVFTEEEHYRQVSLILPHTLRSTREKVSRSQSERHWHGDFRPRKICSYYTTLAAMRNEALLQREVLDLVTRHPARHTGEIALMLSMSVEATKRILNELWAMQLIDCLYEGKIFQCWYPVVRLERPTLHAA